MYPIDRYEHDLAIELPPSVNNNNYYYCIQIQPTFLPPPFKNVTVDKLTSTRVLSPIASLLSKGT